MDTTLTFIELKFPCILLTRSEQGNLLDARLHRHEMDFCTIYHGRNVEFVKEVAIEWAKDLKIPVYHFIRSNEWKQLHPIYKDSAGTGLPH